MSFGEELLLISQLSWSRAAVRKVLLDWTGASKVVTTSPGPSQRRGLSLDRVVMLVNLVYVKVQGGHFEPIGHCELWVVAK